MKSKFFGLNAKLALAVLAVGTMFTSCYDSENGDVTKPYVAPDAVYSFQGVVTNNITGEGVEGATIAFTGAVTGTATTDAWGNYELTVTQKDGVAGTVNMAVSDTEAVPMYVRKTPFLLLMEWLMWIRNPVLPAVNVPISVQKV